MAIDVVFTPEASRLWRKAESAFTGFGSPGLKLGGVLIREAGEKLGIGQIDWPDSFKPGTGQLFALYDPLESVIQLAWELAFPGPIRITDLWYALLCLDADTRFELERVMGSERVNKLHREAAKAVLGKDTVLRLEVIRKESSTDTRGSVNAQKTEYGHGLSNENK